MFGERYFIILKNGNLTDFSHSQYSNSPEFKTEFQIREYRTYFQTK